MFFGNDLKKDGRADIQLKKWKKKNLSVLWIHDESHYAQHGELHGSQSMKSDSLENRPSKIFKRWGIKPDGKENRNNHKVISVSATAFAEKILMRNDNLKGKVTLEVDASTYIGIEQMADGFVVMAKKPIHFYNKDAQERTVHTALDILKEHETGVGIIRACGTASFESIKKQVGKHIGHENVIIVDAKTVKKGIRYFDSLMKKAKKERFVIMIRGMLRMGKTIDRKENVRFVMETSLESKSDTLFRAYWVACMGTHNTARMFFCQRKPEDTFVNG